MEKCQGEKDRDGYCLIAGCAHQQYSPRYMMHRWSSRNIGIEFKYFALEFTETYSLCNIYRCFQDMMRTGDSQPACSGQGNMCGLRIATGTA